MNAPSEKPRPPLPAGPYLVVGLARSGAAAARLLAGRGERVLGCDAGRPPEAAGLAAAGVEVSLDADGLDLLEQVSAVVKSPGVPREAPVIAAARERGTPVVGELELAWRLLPNRFLAVTGTNGKTTVTELLGHIHRTAGAPVAVAGNVGTPLASIVERAGGSEAIVCECSSFQLEDAEAFAPECAVLLNIAPDHLDRHGSLSEYTEAKLRIFANQGADDVAVLPPDLAHLRGGERPGRARTVIFCGPDRGGPECNAEVVGGEIRWRGELLLGTGELRLLGPHNAENAAAAAAAALAVGIDRESVAEGLRSFGGIPHRLEPVAEIGGTRYVNDSKATNVAAAIAALRSFEGGVHAILGGSRKGEGFAPLAEPIAERCRACYLIGEAAERLGADLAGVEGEGVEVSRCVDLAAAVSAAAAAAGSGEVVLLAPACASFDAYRDFEHRGEHFRSLVEALR